MDIAISSVLNQTHLKPFPMTCASEPRVNYIQRHFIDSGIGTGQRVERTASSGLDLRPDQRVRTRVGAKERANKGR